MPLKSSRLIIMINNCQNPHLTKSSGLSHTHTNRCNTHIHTRTFSITAHSSREFLLIESAIVSELINSVWLSCCRGGSHYHHISMYMQNIVVKHSGRCSLCACTVGELNSHLYSDHIEKVWHQVFTFIIMIVEGYTIAALQSLLIFQPDIWLFTLAFNFFFIHFKVFWTFWMGWSRLISLPVCTILAFEREGGRRWL